GPVGRMARTRRPAQSRRRCGMLLGWRPRAGRDRHLHPPIVADVARLRRDRRYRSRPRLHFASVDASQMVSRPARHGDRHGHHGLRRRRDDRRSACQSADELFQDIDLGRPWQTFLAMGAISFFFMMVGAFRYRLPPIGWRPEGWTPPSETKTLITQHHVHLKDAHKTPQFWLIWWVLCLNVSAGIGVIGMASPMLQEIFGGKLIRHPELGFTALSGDQ